MNLIFEKDNPQTINVKIKDDGKIQDFDYMAMIKGILFNGSLGVSELSGDFSDVEKSSIESMIRHLNECVPKSEGMDTLDNEASKQVDDPLAE